VNRPRVGRAVRAALATAAIALAVLPSHVAAALLWTLTASPLTATTGIPTTFTLVGTNGDPVSQIGCIRVTVPGATVLGASIVSASNGRTWLATVNGNTVRVQSQDGGGRLALLQSVTFLITATPNSPGARAWSSNAYTQQDCSGVGSVLGVPPVVVVTGAAPPPTPPPLPAPRPTAAPTPTPRPTPIPTPLASLPLPSVPMPPLPAPSLPPAPAGSASPPAGVPLPSVPLPSASASPVAAPLSGPPAGSGSGPGASAGGGSSGGGAAPADIGPGGLGGRITPAGSDGLSVGGLGSLDAFGLWLVPGTVIAGPGLLAIIWLLIQVLAGMAWLPAARRLRGREEAKRRRPALSR
jgi:hypothetical protein